MTAALVVVAAAVAWAGEFRWTEAVGTLALTEGGKPVLTYRHGAGRDCCYFHPLVSPAGVVLTDDRPEDHRHHRGLFWSWPEVESNGVKADFWILKGGEHRFRRIERRSAGKTAASLIAEHSWIAGGRQIASDRVEMTVHAARNGRRRIEFALTVAAVGGPLRLAGTSDHGKGYGGVVLRFAPRQQPAIRTGEGAVEKDEDHGRHAWAEYEGLFDGRRAGIRTEAGAENPGYPNEWILRPYGLVGESYPGNRTITVEPGKPLTLRYVFTLYDKP